MIGTQARAAVHLAREMADIVPPPPGGPNVDSECYRSWEELMMEAAGGLARSVGYDVDVLDVAVGPELEVGVNPPWRVLLMIAQREAAARDVTRPAAPVEHAIPAVG